MKKNSDLVRVKMADKVLINRIAGNIQTRTGENVSAGDVVADALRALLAARPDLAPTPAEQPVNTQAVRL